MVGILFFVQYLLFSVAKTANFAFTKKMKLKRVRPDNTFKIEESISMNMGVNEWNLGLWGV